jgi:hypothetical protein
MARENQLPKFAKGYPIAAQVVYSNTWAIEETNPRRLLIGPAEGHIDILLALAELWKENYFLLYVLLNPQNTNYRPGRYQSPAPLSFTQISEFCQTFREYLETDGRHHLWVGSTVGAGTLIYDHHNVIFAYGHLDVYMEVLARHGLSEGAVTIPETHSHHYHPCNNAKEDEMSKYWSWKYCPLQGVDGH